MIFHSLFFSFTIVHWCILQKIQAHFIHNQLITRKKEQYTPMLLVVCSSVATLYLYTNFKKSWYLWFVPLILMCITRKSKKFLCCVVLIKPVGLNWEIKGGWMRADNKIFKETWPIPQYNPQASILARSGLHSYDWATNPKNQDRKLISQRAKARTNQIHSRKTDITTFREKQARPSWFTQRNIKPWKIAKLDQTNYKNHET